MIDNDEDDIGDNAAVHLCGRVYATVTLDFC